MADVIYKYGPIDPVMEYLTVKGRPVHIGLQNGEIYIWCLCAVDFAEGERLVRLIATGETYIGPYIGTVVMPSGLVWHLIEVY
jgi:hypothetical protein